MTDMETASSEKQRFACRLADALAKAGFPPDHQQRKVRLAEILDVAPGEPDAWLRGEAFPRTAVLVRLAGVLAVRSNWLLAGIGERVAGSMPAEAPARKDAEPLRDPEALSLARAWRELPARQRRAIQELVQALAQCQG